MTAKEALKEEIHRMNGLMGRIDFSIEELAELKENEEPVTQELLEEIQTSVAEIKDLWKTIRSKI